MTRQHSPDTDDQTSPSEAARDALGAWKRLCAIGGVEVDGRDADLEENLRIALRPSAATLEDALLSSTTDQLLRAFFSVAEPYVAMFRAILDFFQAAGAKQGRREWTLHIDEDHLSLAHFEQLLSRWDELECDVNVPAVDWDGAFAVVHAAHKVPNLSKLLDRQAFSWRSDRADVDEWFHALARDQYRPLPPTLHPQVVPTGLIDAVNIVFVSLNLIRDAWPNRSAMLEEHRARRYQSDRVDGFSLRTIAQHETDHRLANSILILSAATDLEPAERAVFEAALHAELSRFPRRKIGIRAEWPLLERILSLPVWQKRNELYAVWIATEIVAALEGHACELRHEDGRLAFAFRETLLATVKTTWPQVHLYSERKSPVSAPLGKSRKDSVQPDYGLWRGTREADSCGLIVEVKHYKKSSPTSFGEVLNDYAAAHPNAKVVLVNHGAATVKWPQMSEERSRRCSTISDLTVAHDRARKELRQLARDYVGEPVVLTESSHGRGAATTIVIDVSISMSRALDAPAFAQLLQRVSAGQPCQIALVDSEVRHFGPLGEATRMIQAVPRGVSTWLHRPISELAQALGSLVIVTDAEGVANLKDLDCDLRERVLVGGTEVCILELHWRSSGDP